MRNLWRKTAKLFYGRSLLWLPALCAVAVGFLLSWAGGLVASALLYRMLKPDMDRSGIDPRLFLEINSKWLQRSALLNAAVTDIVSFLILCLFTAAFVATASLVAGVEQDFRPDSLAIVRSIRLRMRRIFTFSVKFCLFYVPVNLLAYGSLYLLSKGHFRSYLPLQYVNLGFLYVTNFIVAYLMTPSALRLLQDSPTRRLRPESVRRGRIFTIGAVLCLAVIGYGVAAFENALLASRFVPVIERFTISVVGTLLTTLPYSLLFIALALIAGSESREVPAVTVAPRN